MVIGSYENALLVLSMVFEINPGTGCRTMLVQFGARDTGEYAIT